MAIIPIITDTIKISEPTKVKFQISSKMTCSLKKKKKKKKEGNPAYNHKIMVSYIVYINNHVV